MKCLLVLAVFMAVAACRDDSSQRDGPAPAKWTVRLDDADGTMEAGRVTALAGRGVEVRAGANATVWQSDGEATGTYRLSVQVTQTNMGLHAHGAGLVIGGRDLHAANQVYTYFLVRGDGWFMVKTRDADKTAIVADWTEHSALQPQNAEFTASNELAVEVGKQTTRFRVNGKEVHHAPTAELHTDGLYGGRVVHDQHVRFEQFRMVHLGE